MDNYTFNSDELEYIYATIGDDSQDIYQSSLTGIVAHLPNGKYFLRLKNLEDRHTLRDDLMFYHKIPTITDSKGVWFTVKNNETLELSFVYETIKDIILTLRQQAVLNRRLEKGLIAKNIARHLILDETSTNLGEKYNRESFYDTVQECLDDDSTIWIDDSKSLDDMDVRYLRTMKLLQDRQRLTKQQQILDAKFADLKKRENEIFKH